MGSWSPGWLRKASPLYPFPGKTSRPTPPMMQPWLCGVASFPSTRGAMWHSSFLETTGPRIMAHSLEMSACGSLPWQLPLQHKKRKISPLLLPLAISLQQGLMLVRQAFRASIGPGRQQGCMTLQHLVSVSRWERGPTVLVSLFLTRGFHSDSTPTPHPGPGPHAGFAPNANPTDPVPSLHPCPPGIIWTTGPGHIPGGNMLCRRWKCAWKCG